MPEHRPIRGHIPWTTVDATLRAARSIWLATARPDGRPMVAPLWYWRDSESTPPRLDFVTARPTNMARNLVGQSWIEAHRATATVSSSCAGGHAS